VPAEQIGDVCPAAVGSEVNATSRMAGHGDCEPLGRHRQPACASGLSAIVGAAHAVVAGDGPLSPVESSRRRARRSSLRSPTAASTRRPRMYDTTLVALPKPAVEAMFPLETMGADR
jgi:hypothetical protein